MPKPVAVTVLGWAIVRFPAIQVSVVDVVAGGGVGAGRAPTKWLCTQTIQQKDTQYLLSVLSQCSGEACEKYAEDHGFKPRLQFSMNPGIAGMY